MLRYIIHPDNPQKRYIEQAAAIMKNGGGIAVYPTDTVYGMGTAVSNAKAIDKIGTLLKKDKDRLFSFLCSDFSQMSDYAIIDNNHFKLMKHYLPGPYTFILPASHLVPRKISPKRTTVGVRIPDNPVVLDLINALGEPIANTSLPLPGERRYDPEFFDRTVLNEVDIMLDTGPLQSGGGSTIIDLTDNAPVLIRQGKGVWHE